MLQEANREAPFREPPAIAMASTDGTWEPPPTPRAAPPLVVVLLPAAVLPIASRIHPASKEWPIAIRLPCELDACRRSSGPPPSAGPGFTLVASAVRVHFQGTWTTCDARECSSKRGLVQGLGQERIW